MKDAQSILKKARRCDEQAVSKERLELRDIGIVCALASSSKPFDGHPGFSCPGSSTDAVDDAVGGSPINGETVSPSKLYGCKSSFGAARHADRVSDAERSAKKARSQASQQSEFTTQPLIHDNMS